MRKENRREEKRHPHQINVLEFVNYKHGMESL